MKAFIISFFVAILFMQSCKLKERCEVNNTGSICVKNETKSSIKVFINTTEEFTLAPNERQCVSKPSGSHYLKCWQGLIGVLEKPVNVTECEEVEVVVN
jgi:hypothetical protein